MSYTAPLKDMQFVMEHLAGLDKVAALPGLEDFGADTAQAVLQESARFCQDVVAPLNWEGDKAPSSWKDGVVTTTPGFKEAFRQFAEGGWQGVSKLHQRFCRRQRPFRPNQLPPRLCPLLLCLLRR